jgi:flavin-dependent dehydrogenase
LTYEQAARPLAGEGVVWIGDAAGLAHNESGEGIHPAIESALMAAEAIVAARGDYRLETLDAYRRRMEAHFGPRQARVPPLRATSGFRRRLARWLLGQRWFVRRVVLDRWFLRRR